MKNAAESSNDVISEAGGGFRGFDVAPSRNSSDAVLSFENQKKKKITALGVFDGIGTGLFILKNVLGLDVHKYYSCEIDPKAIRVQLHNFTDEIIMLGSIKNLTEDTIHDLGQVDLLFGGNPCSDLSLVNGRRKGLEGMFMIFYIFIVCLSLLDPEACYFICDFS